jgi:hypothetical protein
VAGAWVRALGWGLGLLPLRRTQRLCPGHCLPRSPFPLSCLPPRAEIAISIASSSGGGVLISLRLARILRLARLLKLVRLLRLSRLAHRLADRAKDDWGAVGASPCACVCVCVRVCACVCVRERGGDVRAHTTPPPSPFPDTQRPVVDGQGRLPRTVVDGHGRCLQRPHRCA